MTTTTNTNTLRDAIEIALRRRDPSATVTKLPTENDRALWTATWRDGETSQRSYTATPDLDALRALALACGLRVETCGACNGRGRHAYAREVEDGCDACECAGVVVVDPAAEVDRLRAELDRAHHALREYGPRCAHPDCDALAPLRCDDCGARFCDAHDSEGGEGHNEIAGRTHAVGPDDLRAGAALRAAGSGR
jgi:hypothetical protein